MMVLQPIKKSVTNKCINTYLCICAESTLPSVTDSGLKPRRCSSLTPASPPPNLTATADYLGSQSPKTRGMECQMQQLFPVSSPLIGSTFAGGRARLMADAPSTNGNAPPEMAPGGDRQCLFIQNAGKHSVFRKRRQLLLQFCPPFLPSIPPCSVIPTSGMERS